MQTHRPGQTAQKYLRFAKGGMAKKFELQQCFKQEKQKLEEIQDNPEYDNGIQEDIRKHIVNLNEDMKSRQKSIDLLKGRPTNQITSYKETIAKVLDKDNSSAEKIQMLFWEQGITITSILTVIGMAISVLVEALLPGSGGTNGTVGKPPPKDEKGVKEWIKNKLKASASLPGRLGAKAAEALPGIIGVIISWILNRAADEVGWVSQIYGHWL